MTNIADKTILLTGASRGIGTFIARELARKKVNLIGISRSQEGLNQFCTEVNNLGSKAIGIAFDLNHVEELPILVHKIEQITGSVDILINNAGIEIYQNFQDYSFVDIKSVLSVNLLAAIELTRLILPNMLRQGEGHIVNIASLAGKKGHPYDSIYSASKAGLVMWTNAIRQELAGTGVNISTICPGYVSTHGLLADTGIPAPSLAGISKPKDVAKAVVRAIEQNQIEVIVNGNLIFKNFTKLLLATEQMFPQFGDVINQWLGITQLNQKRIKSFHKAEEIFEEIEFSQMKIYK